MSFSSRCLGLGVIVFAVALVAQTSPPTSKQSEASSSKHTKTSSARLAADIDSASIANGVYRNRFLSLSCKIPAAWVLRTEEMNAREEPEPNSGDLNPSPQGTTGESRSASPSRDSRGGCPSANGDGTQCGRVLLATFSRPPEARGEDVNASIVIAAEKVEAYPGLKEAVQYFGPLTEVAKAQGFTVDEEPYQFAIGAKKLVRSDFHKDVGTRVMRQSTLAFLAQGYAVSITVIGGTEDEVEELVDGISFGAK